MSRVKYILAVILVAVALASSALLGQPETKSFVIVNAQIADGTGAPLRSGSVRVRGDRIAKVGNFLPDKSDEVIDARRLVVAPGFIDIHNHSNERLESDPLAETQIAQGITTIVMGADGDSPWPVGPWLDAREKNPPSLNVALLVGHATLRERVLGKDFRRFSTAAEAEQMAQLVEQGMREGALGLSSGLEYYVASYSGTDEVVTMATAAAKHGGFYMTHIRDEADRSFEALAEEIAIGERAHIPVDHSHIKLGTVGVWGKAPEYIRVIEAARTRGVDFLADCYPYDAWASGLKVLLPDKQYENPQSVGKALADVGGASHVTIIDFKPNPSYEGHTIEDLARINKIRPAEMFIRMIREGDATNTEAGIIGQSMIERDIKAFYQRSWVMVASDGGIGLRHPRSAGTFPRVLGRYVREKLDYAAGGGPQNDVVAGHATGLERSRRLARRRGCGPGAF